MATEIRRARPEDAEAVGQVIIAALRIANAQDYSPTVIAQVELSFSPTEVSALINKRTVFVALEFEHIVGTASLDGDVIRSVFVHPRCHGRGIGKSLMQVVERTARDSGIEKLRVPSSLTAERFYARLGYRAVREVLHGQEKTIVMERVLNPVPLK